MHRSNSYTSFQTGGLPEASSCSARSVSRRKLLFRGAAAGPHSCRLAILLVDERNIDPQLFPIAEQLAPGLELVLHGLLLNVESVEALGARVRFSSVISVSVDNLPFFNCSFHSME